MPTETCEACGFDRADHTKNDILGTLRAIAPMWQWAVEGVDDDVLATQPAPGVWSAAEYVAHAADVTEAMGRLTHAALAVDHPVVEPPAEVPDPDVGVRHADDLARLGTNLRRLHDKVAKLEPAAWRRPLTLGSDEVDVDWLVAHAVHDATHHLHDVGRGLHALGAGTPSQHGTLVQVSASNGGVPKEALPSAEVGRRGVLGDRQANRKHHGRPLQALCLWSQEVIDALRAEGHPISAGAAGENLTVAGIDWPSLRPGTRLLIGDVLAEISAWATPCKKNAQWFLGGDFGRMGHDRHPGWSRAYAWVIEGGTVRPGDDVIVEP